MLSVICIHFQIQYFFLLAIYGCIWLKHFTQISSVAILSLTHPIKWLFETYEWNFSHLLFYDGGGTGVVAGIRNGGGAWGSGQLQKQCPQECESRIESSLTIFPHVLFEWLVDYRSNCSLFNYSSFHFHSN